MSEMLTPGSKMGTTTHRLGVKGEELVVRLVHGRKVGHLGDVDVDLDGVAEAAAGRLEDGGEVLEGLALGWVSDLIRLKRVGRWFQDEGL